MAVEAKREFVQIIVEVTVLNAILKRAEEPSLQEEGDSVYPQKKLMGLHAATFDRLDRVFISVPSPSQRNPTTHPSVITREPSLTDLSMKGIS